MTTESLQLAGVLVAGVVGIALLIGRAWARGQRDALREDAPVIVAVGIGTVVIAALPLDARLSALLAATSSAVVCLLFVLYSRTRGAQRGADLARAGAAVLGVAFAAIALGLLILAVQHAA